MQGFSSQDSLLQTAMPVAGQAQMNMARAQQPVLYAQAVPVQGVSPKLAGNGCGCWWLAHYGSGNQGAVAVIFPPRVRTSRDSRQRTYLREHTFCACLVGVHIFVYA